MRVTVQVMSLIVMLIIGIFIGVDSAEKNIQKIQGLEGAPRAIQITPQDGKIEIMVLGKVVETKNPVDKIDKEKVEAVTKKVREESNQLAMIGNDMGTGIRQATRGIVELFFGWVK